MPFNVQRVLVITNNLRQASFRLRIEALKGALTARGIALHVEVRPRTPLARRRILKSAAGFDATILQRKMLDPADARLLRRSARRLYYDVDDAVMFTNTDERVLQRWRNWRRFLATARNVDCVVAGNPYLAHWFTRFGAKATRVIPTVVDVQRYQPKGHAPTDHPTLIWIGSRSTLPYLAQGLATLELAAQRMPGLRLLVVADVPLHSEVLTIENIVWTAESEVRSLQRADVGIAPMPKDRWTLGKCGFKLLQYMAAGLPCIASPIGANEEIVRQGEEGFLCETPAQWLEALERLSGDVALRTRMGAAARQRVEQQYSVDVAADLWAQLLSA